MGSKYRAAIILLVLASALFTINSVNGNEIINASNRITKTVSQSIF